MRLFLGGWGGSRGTSGLYSLPIVSPCYECDTFGQPMSRSASVWQSEGISLSHPLSRQSGCDWLASHPLRVGGRLLAHLGKV